MFEVDVKQIILTALPKNWIWGGEVTQPVMGIFILYSSLNNYLREVKKQTKKHLDGLSPQWGGGGFGPSPLFTFFFTFNVKIMSKNWKRMIKLWWKKT